MKKKLLILHIKTDEGIVKAILVDSFLELISDLEKEVKKDKGYLLPQEYMKMWSSLKRFLKEAK